MFSRWVTGCRWSHDWQRGGPATVANDSCPRESAAPARSHLGASGSAACPSAYLAVPPRCARPYVRLSWPVKLLETIDSSVQKAKRLSHVHHRSTGQVPPDLAASRGGAVIVTAISVS